MGDFTAGLWTTKSMVLFVAAQQDDHFSELLILVEQRVSNGGACSVATSHTSATSNDSYATLSFLIFLLVLFGVEHVLTYVRNSSVRRSDTRVRSHDYVIIEEDVQSDSIAQESVILVEPQTSSDSGCGDEQYPLYIENQLEYFRDLQDSLRAGVANDSLPQRADDGTSGVYFMRDVQGKRLAVFKPAGEEGVNLTDCKGDIRPGCPAGEGYLKEVAAFLLDKDGFHGVPRTALATCTSDVFGNGEASVKAVGSLQEFVSSEGSAEDMGSGRFIKHDVHKIGLLDCRIFNKDRHLGNILVTEDDEGRCHLVPIDHGLSLPSTMDGGASFEWMQFPQSRQPFDEETVNFVCNIDVDRDVQTIREELPGVQEDCIDTMKICTIFMKKCVASGKSLFEIGRMMTRYDDESEMCAIEKMYERVSERVQRGAHNYWSVVEEEVVSALVNN